MLSTKFEEEKDDNYYQAPLNKEINEVELKKDFAELKAINTSLLSLDIPCLILSVEKNRPGHIRDLHEKIAARKELEGVLMILYVEHTVDANDLPTALWRFCNNLDPKRDHLLVQKNSLLAPGKQVACMGLDGTRKTKEFDNFHRDWPNIIVADEGTINSVDKKWNSLGIGHFISSPSLKFREQLYGEEAVVS